MNENFSALLGKTLTNIEVCNNNTEIIFTVNNEESYRSYHEQDCCESVYIEDICGDLRDLLNSPITMAEQHTDQYFGNYWDSVTWTFYKLATVKGFVTIRWFGASNGYYSERVDFERVIPSLPID